MKKVKKILLAILLLISSANIFCQEKEKISPYLNLRFIRDTNDSCSLVATLTYSKNRMEMPLPGMNIRINTGSEKILREVQTDSKGNVAIKLSERDLVADKTGMWPFTASYAGNDSIDAGSAEITIRNASLSMTLDEADSIKKINLHAEKYDSGKMIPAAAEVMTVYVTRMFSLLPLGEVTFDEAGNGSVDFPLDLPGDKEGNVTIIARFEDHPEFGNVEKIAVTKWGIPPTVSAHQSRRALWTKTAPRWMIYTLSILLTGVWAHYMFAFISLIRIKKDANKTRKNAVPEDAKDLFIK